jgi:hypothetical protein
MNAPPDVACFEPMRRANSTCALLRHHWRWCAATSCCWCLCAISPSATRSARGVRRRLLPRVSPRRRQRRSAGARRPDFGRRARRAAADVRGERVVAVGRVQQAVRHRRAAAHAHAAHQLDRRAVRRRSRGDEAVRHAAVLELHLRPTATTHVEHVVGLHGQLRLWRRGVSHALARRLLAVQSAVLDRPPIRAICRRRTRCDHARCRWRRATTMRRARWRTWSQYSACTQRCRSPRRSRPARACASAQLRRRPAPNGLACLAQSENATCGQNTCLPNCVGCRMSTVQKGSAVWCSCCKHAAECGSHDGV